MAKTRNSILKDLRHRQDEKEYSKDIQSTDENSVLQVRGETDSAGTYGCRNQLSKTYRTFIVTVANGNSGTEDTIWITTSVVLLALLEIFFAVGIILYKKRLAKVNIDAETGDVS